MKRWLVAALLLLLCISPPPSLIAGTVEDAGKAWLDEHKDPAAVNVNGDWHSKEWGVFHLTQAEGAREVSGTAPRFDVTGVVSGNSLFLLFWKGKGTVSFCATLGSENDKTLTGTYSYRVTRWKFGHGLCQEKGYTLHMTKQ